MDIVFEPPARPAPTHRGAIGLWVLPCKHSQAALGADDKNTELTGHPPRGLERGFGACSHPVKPAAFVQEGVDMALETSSTSNLNPYAAPRSHVEDPAIVAAGQPAFFPVSLVKLALMSLATLNLYQIYWSYQNWKCVQRLNGENVNAPIRAFFYTLTSYSLFHRIRDHAKRDGRTSLQAGLLAIGVFVFAVLSMAADPYWLVTFVGFLPLLPVQSVVNKINREVAPDADPNGRFGGWNILALIVGGAFLFLAIIGTFFVEP
jgi:hypothetical protein